MCAIHLDCDMQELGAIIFFKMPYLFYINIFILVKKGFTVSLINYQQ